MTEAATVHTDPGEPDPRESVAPAETAKPVEIATSRRRVPQPPRWMRRFGTAAALFVVLSAVFGGVFTAITPAFWGHDEITQFGRAYQVAHGGMLPEKIPDDRGIAYGGKLPVSISDLMGLALSDYSHKSKEPAPLVHDPSAYDRLEDHPVSSEQTNVWFTNTAAYSPIPYATDAVAIRIAQAVGADTGGVLLAARLAGLVTYTVLVAFGLRALRGRRIAWLVFALALLPIAVFQAGTVTADTMTNGVAILFSALLLKGLFLRQPLRRLEAAALLASVIVLPLCKPTYFLLALLVLLVPRRNLPGLTGKRWPVPIAALIGFAAFLGWTKISGGTTDGMGLMRSQAQWHTVIPHDQTQWVLDHPLGFARVAARTLALRDDLYFDQFFGQLGFSGVIVPATSIVTALLAIVLAFGIAERVRPRRWATTISAVVVLACVAMIFGTLYLSFTPVGYYFIDGVQGRYFLPLSIVGFAVLLRWIPLRVTVARAGRTLTAVRGPVIAIVALTVISLIAAVLKYDTVVWH